MQRGSLASIGTSYGCVAPENSCPKPLSTEFQHRNRRAICVHIFCTISSVIRHSHVVLEIQVLDCPRGNLNLCIFCFPAQQSTLAKGQAWHSAGRLEILGDWTRDILISPHSTLTTPPELGITHSFLKCSFWSYSHWKKIGRRQWRALFPEKWCIVIFWSTPMTLSRFQS